MVKSIKLDKKTNTKKIKKSGHTISGVDWKKNPSLRIALIIILIVSLGVMIGTIGYTLHKISYYKDNNNIISYNIIRADVTVVDYSVMGLNADKDALHFGKVSLGNSGTRYINLSTKEKAVVTIYVSGAIGKFVSVDENTFIMDANTYKSVPIYLDIFKDATPGFYDGELHVKFLRANK